MEAESQSLLKMEEFFQSRLKKIRSVFKFALENEYSDFYKKKYKDLDFDPRKIENYEQFKTIPILQKDEILSLSLDKKTFVSQDMITHFSVSSGTTTHNKPLVLPQFYPDKYSEFDKQKLTPEEMIYNEEHLVKLGVKNYLVLAAPYMAPMSFLLYFPKKETTAIPGDIKNLAITSMIAVEARISGIVTTPTILLAFVNELRNHLFDFEQIKWIYLFGEVCSTEKTNLIKGIFPKASVEFVFGHSEVCNGASLPGKRCEFIENEKPNIYHIANDYFLETINDTGSLNSFNETGQMLITSLHNPIAFPIIRYQMNDKIMLFKENCKCGNEYKFSQSSASTFEKFKIQGTTISANSIRMSLKNVMEYLEPYFEAHVYENVTDRKTNVALEIHLILKDKYRTRLGLKELIANEITDNLVLSQTKNLDELIKIGVYNPLKLTFIDRKNTNKEFRDKVVSHI